MWSSEQADLEMTEALVREAAWLPQPTTVFRNRVLITIAQQRKQSRWWERGQYAASVMIAASILWLLPATFQTLQDVPSVTSTVQVHRPVTAPTAKSWTLIDDYEWGLVQAALAKQSHSAGLIHGLL